jgi:hypothetical protein
MYIHAVEFNCSQRLKPPYGEYYEENPLVTTTYKKLTSIPKAKKKEYNFILET